MRTDTTDRHSSGHICLQGNQAGQPHNLAICCDPLRNARTLIMCIIRCDLGHDARAEELPNVAGQQNPPGLPNTEEGAEAPDAGPQAVKLV